MKIGRNAPCHCGSEKKFKHCHGSGDAAKKGDWSKVGLAAAGVALALGLVGMVVSAVTGEPDGRVWSAEHGHWHDAQGREIGGRSGPPAGLPPAGKVWSEEHGHWHDAE